MKSVTDKLVELNDFAILMEKYVAAALNHHKSISGHQADRLRKLIQRERPSGIPNNFRDRTR